MASGINPSFPADGVPAVKSQLRANLAAAKNEIEALQALIAAQPMNVFRGKRNRIINGNMAINQRNGTTAKSSVAGTASWGPDRWYGFVAAGGGTFTMQTIFDTNGAPAGHRSYVRLQTTSAKALTTNDVHQFNQTIEGQNLIDFSLGNSLSKSIAIGFWARASQAGAYAVTVCGAGGYPGYCTSYTIALPNTWEYKTIIVPPIVSNFAQFNTLNNTGLVLKFDLGCGIGSQGALGVWFTTASPIINSFPLAVSLITTLNATLDIGGVVLEPGDVSNGWEQYLQAEELFRCQRYAQIVTVSARTTAPGANSYCAVPVPYAAPMRANPAATVVTPGTSSNVAVHTTDLLANGGRYDISSTAGGDFYSINRQYLLESEMVQ